MHHPPPPQREPQLGAQRLSLARPAAGKVAEEDKPAPRPIPRSYELPELGPGGSEVRPGGSPDGDPRSLAPVFLREALPLSPSSA